MRQKSIRLWSVLISVFVILAVMPAVVFAGNTDSIQITTHPQDITAQSGESKTMKVVATNATSYQWQRSSDEGETWASIGASNSNYKNAKTNILTIKVSRTTATFLYRCVVKNSADSVNSNSARINLDQAIEITAQPKNITGFDQEEKVIHVRATNVTSYQWQRSSDEGETWTNIGSTNVNYVGARTADLTIIVGKTTASYVYRCVVSNGANTEMTEVATLTLKSPVEITAQPKSVSGKAGDVKTLTVKASYATSYQWQRSSDDGETWTNIGASNASYSGAKEASLTVTVSNASAGYVYRCEVKNSYSTEYTNTATVTLIPFVKITAQPKSVSGPADQMVTLSITASNATAYQWQRSSDEGATWSNIGASNASYSGVKTDSLSFAIGNTTSGYIYRCEAKNTNGPVYSEPASVTLIPQVKITANPKSVTGKAGDEKTFSITASNATSYQWQRSADGGNTWTNIGTSSTSYTGAKTDTLSFKIGNTTSGYIYRCVVANSAFVVESKSAAVTMILPPVFTEHPESVGGLSGDEMIMTVSADNASAYQWQRSADGEKWSNISESNANYSGVKTDTLTIVINNTTGGFVYRCVAKNYAGSTASEVAAVELDTSRAYVTFDANGGELVIDDVSYQSYTFTAYTDEVISNIPYAQKDERYQLVGWYLDAAGTKEKKVDLETYVVTGNVTLYAKWELKGVILPFVPVN